MNKSIFLPVLIFCLLVLAACGKTEEEVVYYDFQVESRLLEGAEVNQTILGRQYYQGGPVCVLGELVKSEEKGYVMDVYLQPAGKEKQLMMSGVSRNYRSAGWYLDGDGNCFVPQTDGVIRLDGDGNMLYYGRTDGSVEDICELGDGRIILLTKGSGNYGLAELNPVTGVVSKIDNVVLESGSQYIGASGDRLMLLDEKGFWHVDPKKGTRTLELPFEGTFYTFQTREQAADFWVDGSNAGIIWTAGVEEQLVRVNVSEGKEIIVVRGRNFDYTQLRIKDLIYRFNRSNDTYYAVIEEEGSGGAPSTENFSTQTDLQIAAGKGADIIYGNALSGNNVYSLIDKGVFADLKPLMEASGMSEEDFFPGAFGWKQEGRIYGVSLTMNARSYTMDKSLLEEGKELTIDTFLDIMLDPDEKRFLFGWGDESAVLDYLLSGSEDLWGLIDWEKGTCDFSGERFARMLQAAERCAYNQQHDYPYLLDYRYCFGFYSHETEDEMEKKNRMMAGYLFEDGAHGAITANYTLGINAGSKNIEGAWQLLEFLLGEEAQTDVESAAAYPVNRKAFDRMAQEEMKAGAVEKIERVVNGVTIESIVGIKGDGKDLTQEKIDDMIRYLEDVKVLPVRTQTLITIIEEETADYFSGLKSREEVIDMLQNRVQLYLDEQKTDK